MLAGLRLGLYELLFSDATPDHASVDQAVELVKRAGPPTPPVSSTRCCSTAREREQLSRALLADDSTPELAAVAHSAPLWLVRMWWEELGAEQARSLLAACNEPPEVAMRLSPGIDREAMIAGLRESGVEARAPEGPWPLALEESIVIEGRAPGRGCRPGSRPAT